MVKKVIIIETLAILILLGIDFLPKFLPLPASQSQKIIVREIFTPPSPTIQPQQYDAQAVSLQSIFALDHTWVATLSAERKRVVLATGDVMPARHVNILTTKMNNFIWPFEKTKDVLRMADITLINLETPLIKNCPFSDGGFTFCGDERNVEGLVAAGGDIADMANNHAGNYGYEGIVNTTQLLNNSGILPIGQGHPSYKNIRGITFGFLAYNDIGGIQKGIAWADENKIQQDITDAKNHADIVIVEFHWGTEYTDQPNDRQKKLGLLTIDAGADLIIGNHPHWIQSIEVYNGKLIAYSHGNFVFDQEWSLKTKQGVVGKYTFYDKTLIDVEFLPMLIEDYGQPSFLEGNAKHEILNHMRSASEILQQMR